MSHTSHPLLHILQSDPTAALDLSEAGWQRVLDQATRHGVGPVVFKRLKYLDLESAPPPAVWTSLRDQYAASAARNLGIAGELNRILRRLHSARVPVMVMKGAHLSQAVYQDLALRTMNDIDLLVHPQDLAAAEQELLQAGYQHFSDPAWYEAHHFHYVMRRQSFQVELHWDVQTPDDPFQIDVEAVWRRACSTSLCGVSVQVFSPEDLLAYLPIQVAYQHPFDYFPLRNLQDIAQVANLGASKIDWSLVVELARAWRAENPAYLSFRLAQDLLGAAIPETALQGLKPEPFDPQLLDWAAERIFTEGKHAENLYLKPRMSSRFKVVATSQGVRARLAAFAATCFPARATIAEMYDLPVHSAWIFPHYLLRLKDLAARNLRTSWLLLRRDPGMLAWTELEVKRIALVDWMLSPRR